MILVTGDFPCITDPCSVQGLRRLAVEHPWDWDTLILEHRGAGKLPFAEATVADVLRSGLLRRLFPNHVDDVERLRCERAGARRLVEVVAELPIAEVAEHLLVELRTRFIDGQDDQGGSGLSPAVASRAVALLRQAAWLSARRSGVLPRVSRRAGRAAKPAPARASRQLPTLRKLKSMLLHGAPAERAVLALSLGGGLGEADVLRLRRCDVHAFRSRTDGAHLRLVLVRTLVGEPGGARSTEAVRIAVLPPWAAALVIEGLPTIGGRSTKWLFPHRYDHDRHAPDFRSMLSRLSRMAAPRLGSASYSLADVRRAWQCVAREALLPRELVRQSWRIRTGSWQQMLHTREGRALHRLALHWLTLGSAVAGPLRDAPTLARRAPKGCLPHEPELSSGYPKDWCLLPASCQI